MKKLLSIALVLVLSVSLLAGCRSRQEDNNTNTTSARGDMMPDSGNILPDASDKIDPTNGANRDETMPSAMTDPTMPSATGSTGTTDTTGTTGSNSRNRRHPMP